MKTTWLKMREAQFVGGNKASASFLFHSSAQSSSRGALDTNLCNVNKQKGRFRLILLVGISPLITHSNSKYNF